MNCPIEARIRVLRRARLRQTLMIARVDRRSQFEPALPIGAPEHLLHEFLARREAVLRQHTRHHLVLADQAMAQVRREHGDIVAVLRAGIGIA